MLEAFLWGALASGTLLLGAIIAYMANPSPKMNAIIMAIGAGLLMGSVSYDLIEEALKLSSLLMVATIFFWGRLPAMLSIWWPSVANVADMQSKRICEVG